MKKDIIDFYLTLKNNYFDEYTLAKKSFDDNYHYQTHANKVFFKSKMVNAQKMIDKIDKIIEVVNEMEANKMELIHQYLCLDASTNRIIK